MPGEKNIEKILEFSENHPRFAGSDEKNPVFCGCGIEKSVLLLHIINMADKSKNTDRSRGGESRHSQRETMIWLAVVLSVAAMIAIGIAWCVLSVLPRWFDDNPRMVMRRIELTSRNRMSDRSFWNNHKGVLIRRLEL